MKRNKAKKSNKTDSCRAKAMISTGLAILCLLLLGAGAVELPRIYSGYADKQLLNQPEYSQNNVETYSYAYASMGDKLEEIARYQINGGTWQAVNVSLTNANNISDGEIISYLSEELDKLYQFDVLPGRLSIEEDEPFYKELLMLYPSDGGDMFGSGSLLFWSLNNLIVIDEYGTPYYLNLLMDAQFHSLITIYLYPIEGRGSFGEEKYWETWDLFKEEGWEPSVDGRYYLGECMAEGLSRYYGITDTALTDEDSSSEDRSIAAGEEPDKYPGNISESQTDTEKAEAGYWYGETVDNAETNSVGDIQKGETLPMYGQLHLAEDTYMYVYGAFSVDYFEMIIELKEG